jgi:aspartyl-tRNA(Asn)/glutamyl-tRNA(Gln) amidotransferase subunit A
MIDWTEASLVDTADAIQAGRLKARDLAEATLDKTEKLAVDLGCYVSVDSALYRAAADAADGERAAGRRLGPLHGIPLAHKDMFYRKDRVSGCGSRLRVDIPQSTTATVLDRLDDAGALEVGRLVMVEFAMGPHGYNENYPQCRNPWNLDHIPSGSSSGSGVAVGARLVHASLGSDTGGSIRCPAAATGVVGLVPTHGRVSRYGAMPMSFSLDVIGPLTRTVRDAARILDVIAGPDPKDASAINVASGGFESGIEAPARPLRVGVAHGYFDANIHIEIKRCFEAAAEDIGNAGFVLTCVDMPTELLGKVANLHPLLMKAEAAANHMNTMRSREGEYSVEVANRLHAGFFIPAADYIQALKIRGGYLREFVTAAFADCDVLLTPTLAVRVPTIAETMGKRGKDYLDMVGSLTRNTKVVNFMGLPAMTVPCGFDSRGLPIGMQLIGRPFDEVSLLRVGHAFQRRTDWHSRRPGFMGVAAASDSPASVRDSRDEREIAGARPLL